MSRQRSQPSEYCPRCSVCIEELHHWDVTSVHPDQEAELLDLEKACKVAGDTFIVWGCHHCPIWMEILPEDVPNETDLDKCWEHAHAAD